MTKALILGATGLTGNFVLEQTLKDDYFSEIYVLSRRELQISHPKLKVIVSDFKEIPKLNVDIVFSCLGTTKKKTPNAEDYRFIEIGIPAIVSETLIPLGLKQFHYISSLGTGPKSPSAYSKMKWEAEETLRSFRFQSLYLYRPSLIYGPRKEKRFLEDFSNSIFSAIEPFMKGKLKKYSRINAEVIAAAMIANSKSHQPGTWVLESDKIQELGE